jgi:hypothetical protein
MANPSATNNQKIFPGVWMPLWTGDLAYVSGDRVISANEVLAIGNRLKMSRVAALRISTKMVDYQPVRDWPAEDFVRSAMNSLAFSVDKNAAVSASSRASSPFPAAILSYAAFP